MWSATAYAATQIHVVIGNDLASIPLVAWAITVMLSAIGGAAATLQRLSSAGDLSRWKLEVARDLVCSIVAGLVAFFFCEAIDVSSATEAGAITVAGYGSSKVLDMFLTKFQQKIEAS
jgi:hypothetical protein